MEISAILAKYLISEGVFQGHCGMFELHSWQKLYSIKVRKISILFHINTFLILNEVNLRFLHVSLKERVPL